VFSGGSATLSAAVVVQVSMAGLLLFQGSYESKKAVHGEAFFVFLS
jgi:hypothetical protein